jgi:hypothetical protein
MTFMSKPVTHTESDGVWNYKLSSWRQFHELILDAFLERPSFVWRGQRKASWALESSLGRALKGVAIKKQNQLANGHLTRFKLASRGRRGFAPQKLDSDNDWWALAQHNGMVTPLLDWTESPYVALYFAFEQESDTTERAVYGLGNLSSKLREIESAGLGYVSPPLEFVRPMRDDNARLVSQSGLFTRLPLGITVGEWVRKNFEGDEETPRLVKITMPDDGRDDCLVTLNRMNINHLSLFPDLFGAGEHCNKALRIAKYSSSARL